MKKQICLTLVVMLVFTIFVGCSSKKTEETTSPTQQETYISDVVDWYDFPQYESTGKIRDCKELDFGTKCETHSFLYNSDGFWVKGFISIPEACISEKTPCNCIVYNRGGNVNMGYVTGEEIAMICDATGRVVVASQYRGADGSQGKDEFGGADVSDVISLIDLCEQEFEFADINNLCMVGVSRGGMMSYITARKDTRVKGVVAVSAVTDLTSAYNQREDMKIILGSSIGGSPEDKPKEYAQRSAINWADEINVPVYIIHSKNDELVSVTQAEEMSEKLESLQKDVTLKIYKDDVHGFHKEDIPELVQWINQKLPRN